MVSAAITGITGFIGSHLAKKLVDKGYEVYGIMRPSASRTLEPVKDILNDIVLIAADITDQMSTLNALRTADPDYVCHLAALSPVRLSFERPFEYERINYLGTMNVAHAIMELPDYRKRKLVAASTAEVYGIQTHGELLKEDDPLNPSSPYSVSKVAADMYLRMAAKAYDLNAVVLRPVNTYGRKFETNFIVEYLITSMLKNGKVYLGAPKSIREYMYVDDHAEAYLHAMDKGVAGEAYNIGTGKGLRNEELARKIADIIGYDSGKIAVGAYPPGYPIRPLASDQPYILLDSNKARQHLGWLEKVDLDEGLRRTIEYWRSRVP
jgi:GDP-mannose 4,6-dehydratase